MPEKFKRYGSLYRAAHKPFDGNDGRSWSVCHAATAWIPVIRPAEVQRMGAQGIVRRPGPENDRQAISGCCVPASTVVGRHVGADKRFG